MSTNTQRAMYRVKDVLREGGTLMNMNDKTGRRWFILPPASLTARSKPAREVEAHIAELVIREVDVFPSHDGIWPGTDQTYKMGDGGNANEGSGRNPPQTVGDTSK